MQLILVDSSRGELFFKYLEEINCLNLNCLFRRSRNLDLVYRELLPIKNFNSINLCNFASLCFKLRIEYGSDRSLQLLKTIVDIIRSLNPNIEFIQMQVSNYDEEDLRPISRLYLLDREKDLIYVNRVLRDSLRILGFSNAQIMSLPLNIKNLVDWLPEDMCSYMRDSDIIYEKIIGLLQ